MKSVSHHVYHYLPLIGVLAVGLLGLLFFSYDRAFQFAVMTALSSSYVAWGIIHHYLHDDLHATIIIEYLSIALLGMVIVFSVLFRS